MKTPQTETETATGTPLLIGWASVDLTPEKPVELAGQFHVRVSEGVLDPITCTALALSSGAPGLATAAVMVSCDFVSIAESLLADVRARLAGAAPDLDPRCVFLNGTHTHTAPEVRLESDRAKLGGGISSTGMTLDLGCQPVAEYMEFAAGRIAQAVVTAWRARTAGAIGYGLGHAVVGRNRRSVYDGGVSRMYGDTSADTFSHIEGYEDAGVNLLATWDAAGVLTGLVVNVACPSQVSEHLFQVSADYWHETRLELRRRLGAKLFVLPQCSAAGDQSPHVQWYKAAAARMLQLSGRTPRQEIAVRIADAVSAALPCLDAAKQTAPAFRHHVETIELSRRKLSEEDVREALAEAAPLRARYDAMRRDLEAHPEKRAEPRWYVQITQTYRRMKWFEGVKLRWDSEQTQPRLPFEVHVVRLGEVAFASNPFEYYLDFGMRIKARSPAVQTFLIQLAGSGTYVPTERAVAGKSYGAVPASTPIGPEGGRELAEWTVAALKALWSGSGAQAR